MPTADGWRSPTGPTWPERTGSSTPPRTWRWRRMPPSPLTSCPTRSPRRRRLKLDRQRVAFRSGTIIGARSGDKGGNANVGLWARSDEAWRWLDGFLTIDAFRALLPEADDLEVQRYEFANLRALNFVVVGLLGEGVASSTRPDPQAKGLGEYLRSRVVDIPVDLLADHPEE